MSLNEAALDGGPLGRAARRPAVSAPRAAWARLPELLEAALDAERGRWFLWLPVLFGAGVALYLGLPTEPPLGLGLGGLLVATSLRIFLRRTSFGLILGGASLAMAAGFVAAKVNTIRTDAPVLDRTLRYATVDGWVERVERAEKRTRLTLRIIAIERLTPEKTPRLIRISLHGDGNGLVLGEAVRLKATLMPPPEPAEPGGFDFARHFWFKGLGASGYGMGKIEPLAGARPPPWDLRLSTALASVRRNIETRIDAVLTGDHAAIAKALIVGGGGELSEAAKEILRDSGLAHVISISGLHMALTAGAMFWAARALLALFSTIALRFPIKIWAAIAALAVAGIYLALSGGAVTAVRSFIMVAVAFIAVMLNRPPLSLRNLALAALVILAVAPDSLVDAGFQMSFAATAALIAFYETRRLRFFPEWPRLVAVPLAFFIDAGATTFFASLAVDPLAAYHFHRIAVYAMIGNLLAVPAVSFVVMPMVLLTLLAIPFGAEAGPLAAMNAGIGWMLAVARFTAGLPGAVVLVPSFGPGALPLLVAGGLWLIIWRGAWRWLGLLPLGAGLAMAPSGDRPDIWVDREGKLIAVRDKDGRIATTNIRAAAFSLERWMDADGDHRPPKEVRGAKTFQCDSASCVAMVKGKLVSHVHHPSALRDDCRRAAVLIAQFPITEPCTQPEIVIDSLALAARGAHTLRVTREGLLLDTANDNRGERPWALPQRWREKIPAIASEEVLPERAKVIEKPPADSSESAAQ
jgi:competence protein ComEC